MKWIKTSLEDYIEEYKEYKQGNPAKAAANLHILIEKTTEAYAKQIEIAGPFVAPAIANIFKEELIKSIDSVVLPETARLTEEEQIMIDEQSVEAPAEEELIEETLEEE